MLLDCSGSFRFWCPSAGRPCAGPQPPGFSLGVYTTGGLWTFFRLFDLEQLHVEGEGRVGRNDAGVAAAAVGVVRRADQLGALADAQLGDSLVPAADDLALADGELEGLVAVARRIELQD